MNFAPQVETAEISDAALDAVSGGLAAGGAGGLHVETPLADVCADLLAVGSADGVVAGGSIHVAAH
ncbi:hypothetical protein [Streptomyces griseus]|uniref:hypothetical protein n=1 Tax=Streptomyces griseus TaxID=1911 RepID=UPI0005601818|nr:hypothetical protein [Streptomyces griseus]